MTRGRLIIMGSGETSPTMMATHRAAIASAGGPEVLVLDTPFGFQENVDLLIAKLVEFFDVSLGIRASVATLRSVDAEPIEVERFRLAVAGASALFAGPGSPSYALRVWRRHGVAGMLVDMLMRGGSVTLASAAALTAGRRTLPVYEIYKAGEPPRWLDGLDLLGPFGISLVIVPHWNNAEGGNHDTSRCFIGERRMGMLASDLDCGILGVDEHTAVTIDLDRETLSVTGRGTATLRGRTESILPSGTVMALEDVAQILGVAPTARPTPVGDDRRGGTFDESIEAADVDGIISTMLAVEEQVGSDPALHQELRSMIVRLGEAAGRGLIDPRRVVAGFVELLLELRRDARDARRYEESDRIRDGLAELGVEVRDTGQGAVWEIGEDQNP